MTNNYDNYGYENDSRQERSSFIRRIIIVLMIVVAILLIIFLVKSCNNRKKPTPEPVTFAYEDTLLDGAKKYFDVNYEKYPKNSGECFEIELQALIESGHIKAEDFSKCNTTNTYVKVCKMENGAYHFYPWLVCSDKNSESEYESERIGSQIDVIPNKTVVSFKYMPQKYENGDAILGKVEELWKDEIKYEAYKTLSSTTYYRYRDKLYRWSLQKNSYYTSKGDTTSSKAKEYYVTSPSSSYTQKDKKSDGYKWYTTSAKKTYAVDSKGVKIFSHDLISGYPYYDNGVCAYYQTRTVTGTTNAYHYYKCSKSKNSTTYIYQLNTKCGSAENPTYSYQVDSFYTCGYGVAAEIEAWRVGSSSAKCNTYSEWKNTPNACDTTQATCRQIAPYCVYNWYKVDENSNKKYYPSGSSNASSEKVYYTEAPVNGAIKDTSTKTTVYRWYKTTTTTSSSYTAIAPSGYDNAIKLDDYKYSDWTDYSTKNPKVSDGRVREIENRIKIKLQEIKGSTNEGWNDLSNEYLDEESLVRFLQEKNYNVTSLNDIANLGEIKLKLQMLVRNKKESK